MKLRIATDFSGIGVPEMALQALKIPHTNVFACENDKFARTTYLANFKPKIFYDDITTRNHAEVGPVDLYIAGFPCQSFSLCGLRQGFKDVRGTLFFDMAKFIKTNKPKVFILENVKGLLSHDKPKGSKAKYGNTFNTIINLLAQTVNGQYAFPFYTDNLGYHVYYQVLNSKDFGVPQTRERIFIVGFRDDDHAFSFPTGFPLKKCINDLVEDNPDKKYSLSESQIKLLMKLIQQSLIDVKITHPMCLRWQNKEKGVVVDDIASTVTAGGKTCIRHLNKIIGIKQLNPSKESNGQQPYQQNRIYDANGIIPTLHAEMSCGSYAIAPKIIKKRYRRHQQDAVFNSPTLQSSGNGHIGGASAGYLKFLIKSGIRRLTPLECFRLQDIPDEMFFRIKKMGISDSQLYKQAGNAMTRSVMMAIIDKIKF